MAEVYLDLLGRVEQVQKDLKDIQTEMVKLEAKSEQVNKTVRKEFESTGQVAGQLRGIITGIFSIGAITAFIKKMIDLRSEWGKQTAVIKTLTGSQKEAEATMKMIKKIADASLTPLKEVSDAYIRLRNEGIKATYSEMKKMTDVAVSAGRSFGQLAEAIFDATNQQTRGLRDFGIVSKIQGDKIQLSFKGMTESVDMTGESIADFVIKAGEMNGVMGASEAVGNTLAGTIDNIGDEIETLILTLGKFSEGEIVTAVNVFTDMLTIINRTIELTSSSDADKSRNYFKDIAMHMAKLVPVFGDVLKGFESRDILAKFLGMAADKLNKLAESQEEVKAETDDTGESIEEFTLRIRGLISEMAKGMPLEKWAAELQKAAIAFALMMRELPEDPAEAVFILPPPEDVWEAANVIEDLVNDMYDKLEQSREEYEAYLDMQNTQRIAKERLKADAILQINDLVAAMFMRNREDELKAAGDSAEKKEAIERKYANRAKLFSISQALIQGLLAMQKNRAELGTILAAPVNIWQGILTALTIATIAAQKFATGVLDLQGRGTGTSDSIPAMLSHGESVMTAKETQEYYPYLKAMKEGKFPKLQLDLMKDYVTNNNLTYDNSKEIKELREIRRELSKERTVEYVEGKYKIIKRGGITTKIALN